VVMQPSHHFQRPQCQKRHPGHDQNKDRILHLPKEVGIFWLIDGELILDRLPKKREVQTILLSEYWRLSELKMLFRGIIKGIYRMHVDKLQNLLASYPKDVVDRLTCGLLKARYRKYYSEAKNNGDISGAVIKSPAAPILCVPAT